MTGKSKLVRPGRVVLALMLGAAVAAMAIGVDAGLTQDWAKWAKVAWVLAMLVGLMAAVFTLLNAVGLLTSESLADRGSIRPDGKELRLWHFITVYAGSLLASLALAVWLEQTRGVDGERTMMGAAGALFLIASSDRPWWVYETIRRLGWFDTIESDRWMRRGLGLLGAVLVLTFIYTAL